MTQRVFEPKVLALVANIEQSVTWGVQEFGKYFSQYDAIIRGNVSIRFQVQNLTLNSIYLSLNYETLYENIPFQERKSLAGVAANTTVELSKATVPAIGLLKTDIKSITISVIGAATGTVRITLLILDGDELASESGSGNSLLGVNETLLTGYTVVGGSAGGAFAVGVTGATIYTVPAGKRCVVASYSVTIAPTPSYPGLIDVIVRLFVSAVNMDRRYFSSDEQYISDAAFQSLDAPLSAGDTVRYVVTNNDTVARDVFFNFVGLEIF